MQYREGSVGHYGLLTITSNIGNKVQAEDIISNKFGKDSPYARHFIQESSGNNHKIYRYANSLKALVIVSVGDTIPMPLCHIASMIQGYSNFFSISSAFLKNVLDMGFALIKMTAFFIGYKLLSL